MLIFRQFVIKKNERGLLFKSEDFQNFLNSGTYHFFDPLYKIHVETYDLSAPEFNHPLADFFIKEYPDEIAQYFIFVELNERQIALIYKNNQLVNILPPTSRKLYWKGIAEIKADIIDIQESFEIPKNLMTQVLYSKILPATQIEKSLHRIDVPEHHSALLYVDEICTKVLEPGLYAFWKFNHSITGELWDLRLQMVEISGQEILTKDKVSLRINLSASYFVRDILRVKSVLPSPANYLYKELQFGLRAIVGTRSFDELLEDKTIVDKSVFDYIVEKTANLGIEIQSVGVKDIILPGNMQTILNKVVEAEKIAQANLIKRREETAATRSLLNTAKVMENNPSAWRLKEMEVLEKIADHIQNVSVYSGIENLLKDLVKVRRDFTDDVK
jgi:regulator of protease activity HflC (stomatin/prohibitin superfamily)